MKKVTHKANICPSPHGERTAQPRGPPPGHGAFGEDGKAQPTLTPHGDAVPRPPQPHARTGSAPQPYKEGHHRIHWNVHKQIPPPSRSLPLHSLNIYLFQQKGYCACFSPLKPSSLRYVFHMMLLNTKQLAETRLQSAALATIFDFFLMQTTTTTKKGSISSF